jgi:hypothetical protein
VSAIFADTVWAAAALRINPRCADRVKPNRDLVFSNNGRQRQGGCALEPAKDLGALQAAGVFFMVTTTVVVNLHKTALNADLQKRINCGFARLQSCK